MEEPTPWEPQCQAEPCRARKRPSCGGIGHETERRQNAQYEHTSQIPRNESETEPGV